MIADSALVPILAAAIATTGAVVTAVLAFTSARRGTRNAEDNTELAQLRAVIDTRGEEIDRLNDDLDRVRGQHALCEQRLDRATERILGLERAVEALERRSQ